MNFAAIKDFDIANGPGIRVTLFVSGCPHRCKGCFNAETWDYDFGQPFTVYDMNQIIDLLGKEGIGGFTVLGGEPMAPQNVYKVSEIITQVRSTYPNTNIWVYTGYTLEQLYDRMCSESSGSAFKHENLGTSIVLKNIDVLVDGPFIEAEKDLRLRFRGSSNQRIIDMREFIQNGQNLSNIPLMAEYMNKK